MTFSPIHRFLAKTCTLLIALLALSGCGILYMRDIATDALDPSVPMVTICGGTGCNALGSKQVYDAFETEIKKQGLEKKVMLKRTGCHGFCEKGPVVVIMPDKYFYPGVQPEDVPKIVKETVIAGKAIDQLLYTDPVSDKKCTYEYDVPFYAKQQRHVFRDNGRIDPVDIED